MWFLPSQHAVSYGYEIWSVSVREEHRSRAFEVLWIPKTEVDCTWNVMAHAQKPDFVFRPNGRAHLNGRGRQFNRLLAAEVCASAVVMLDTPCSEVVWRVLANHSIRQFPLHFPSRASPCAIAFQLDYTVPGRWRMMHIFTPTTWNDSPLVGQGILIVEASRSHTTTYHSR